MRHRAKRASVPEFGPVVYDQNGRPVGVHVDAAPALEDSTLARRVMRLDALRKTGELDAQYRVRCQVSLFCSDPRR